MSEAPRSAVAIIDYGVGNLYSVQRACEHVGLSSTITASPDEVLAASGVVLPGVGAMPDAMQALDASGLSDALRRCAERGTPIMGVCLGLQLLMTSGSEFRPHKGLGIISGKVVRFPDVDEAGHQVRVPHIGWNAVGRSGGQNLEPWEGTPLQGTPSGTWMYFVHSYYAVPDDPAVTIATAQYGGVEFCAALRQGTVFACQFHPERSGSHGLALYREFAVSLGSGAGLTRSSERLSS